MKKFLVILVIMVTISVSVFAGAENLSVDEDTMMMTYVYVVENTPVIELIKSTKYKAYARAELSGVLQEAFELDRVHFSQVNYDYEPGKILLQIDFEVFYKLNLM